MRIMTIIVKEEFTWIKDVYIWVFINFYWFLVTASSCSSADVAAVQLLQQHNQSLFQNHQTSFRWTYAKFVASSSPLSHPYEAPPGPPLTPPTPLKLHHACLLANISKGRASPGLNHIPNERAWPEHWKKHDSSFCKVLQFFRLSPELNYANELNFTLYGRDRIHQDK